ncbi:hypothetical protein SAMN05216283_11472 [Sunxiuqinia elliptica]|uniref:Uncharacterized protein n=1 Tax=Sunxiuqinia elliptica TaxID=655355 RepID=A0A1I2L2A7_9BACT|nr:hypothetical protein SAMN05216283_11472 [Sunxiuqinia elliptica]
MFCFLGETIPCLAFHKYIGLQYMKKGNMLLSLFQNFLHLYDIFSLELRLIKLAELAGNTCILVEM